MVSIIRMVLLCYVAGAAMFDMEYARWLEEDHRLMGELRNGLQAPLSDSNMRVMVDGYLSHYDEIFRLKGVAAKSDVFHLINGMWTSQAERCFLWIGGFRPSDLIMVCTLYTIHQLHINLKKTILHCPH